MENKEELSEKEKYLIKGELYDPILFGEEDDDWGGKDNEEDTCADCGCAVGEQHYPNCDIERCPCCGLQMLSCDCGTVYSVKPSQMKDLPRMIKEQEIENKKLKRDIERLLKKQKDAEM